MNKKQIQDREKRMERENAKSVLERILVGSGAILMVGILAFAMLFVVMLLI